MLFDVASFCSPDVYVCVCVCVVQIKENNRVPLQQLRDHLKKLHVHTCTGREQGNYSLGWLGFDRSPCVCHTFYQTKLTKC